MHYDIMDRLEATDAEVVCDVCAPAPPGTGIEFTGTITGQVTLRNAGAMILARGVLRGVAAVRCSRCLREYEEPLEFEVCEDCGLTQIDEPISYTAEFGDDEPVPIPILDHQRVDLSELVRQMLVVYVPGHPICSPDCRGLCPHCGVDLNATTCSCDERELDPRLAPLRDLLQ